MARASWQHEELPVEKGFGQGLQTPWVGMRGRRAAAIIAGKLPPNYKSRPCKEAAFKARDCERRSQCWSYHSDADRLVEVRLKSLLCPVLKVRLPARPPVAGRTHCGSSACQAVPPGWPNHSSARPPGRGPDQEHALHRLGGAAKSLTNVKETSSCRGGVMRLSGLPLLSPSRHLGPEMGRRSCSGMAAVVTGHAMARPE